MTLRPYILPVAVGVGLAAAVLAFRHHQSVTNLEFRMHGAIGEDVRADDWVPAIEKACTNPKVGSILLRIRSGGGDPGEGSRIADAISGCKVPVHTLIERIGASAAILPAIAGDTVSAEPYALVGGLGIVQSMTSWASAADKFGVVDRSVASGRLKLAYNPMTRIEGPDLATIQDLVDRSAENFMAEVSNRRPAFKPTDVVLAGGLTTPDQAITMGLIDQIQTADQLKRESTGPWQDATPDRRHSPKDALSLVTRAVVQGIRAELSNNYE